MKTIRNLYKFCIKKQGMKPSFDLQQFAYSHSENTITRKNKKSKSSLLAQDNLQSQCTIKNKRNPIKSNYLAVLYKIIQWRKINIAPVDTMGCQRLSDPNASLQIQKYQILISLMLSIQTKDETTSMIVNRLKEYGLTPQNIVNTPEQKLIKLIYECNFNKRKAANLITVSRTILQERRIAKTQQELLKYPGVGVKIAMLYMKVAEGQEQIGIGVDTHVHRISNRLGWVKTNSPEQTEKQLQQVFPPKVWKDINICMVGFGQLRCNAKKPLCKGCPVQNDCPSMKYDW